MDTNKLSELEHLALTSQDWISTIKVFPAWRLAILYRRDLSNSFFRRASNTNYWSIT
jgi:hypothetical protein